MSQSPRAFEAPVYVARPLIPPLAEYTTQLEAVWTSAWFTNGGARHVALEAALAQHLGAPCLSLFNNGTSALETACRALSLRGEVITTPFTFPATPHVLACGGLQPVFADVDPNTLTLDPASVARCITERTSAILAVHVYGMPCDVEGLQRVADAHGLKVVYDAAHAFGTEVHGVPVARYGDATMFSFHATKLFHTAEGGALAVRDAAMKERVDLLKNFGIRNETDVVVPGVNGKMSEVNAALGLAVLPHVPAERQRRANVLATYRQLEDLPGLEFFNLPAHVRPSLQYCVLRVNAQRAPLSRDGLYARLRDFNVIARRYFYPLCSEQPCYRMAPGAGATPHAARAAAEVLALPFHGGLDGDAAQHICDIVRYIWGTA